MKHLSTFMAFISTSLLTFCKPADKSTELSNLSDPQVDMARQPKLFDGNGSYICEGVIKSGNQEYGTIVSGNFGHKGKPEFDGYVTSVQVIVTDNIESKTIHTEVLKFNKGSLVFVSDNSGMKVVFKRDVKGGIAKVTTGAKQTDGVVYAAKPTEACRAVKGQFLTADGTKRKFEKIDFTNSDSYFCTSNSPNIHGYSYLIELATKQNRFTVEEKIRGKDVVPQISVKGNDKIFGPFRLTHRGRLLRIGQKHWYRLPAFPQIKFELNNDQGATAELIHIISGAENKIVPQETLTCEKAFSGKAKDIYDKFYTFEKAKGGQKASKTAEKLDIQTLSCKFKCQAKSGEKTTLSGAFKKSGKQCITYPDGKEVKDGDLSLIATEDFTSVLTAWCKKNVYAETKNSDGSIKQAVKAAEVVINQ